MVGDDGLDEDVSERPRDARTQQIVETGYALLGQSGLEGLTIRAVLERAGLARRAFYERFSSKDELVLAVFAYAIQSGADHLEQEVAQFENPLSRLRLVIDSIALGHLADDDFDPGLHDRRGIALSREHLRLADTRPGDLQAALSPLIDLIARLLSEGMAAGLIRTASPRGLASLIYNVVATTVHTEYLSKDVGALHPHSRERLASEVWDFCLQGISAA